MRWLAMFPKFSFSAGKTALAARIGAVGELSHRAVCAGSKGRSPSGLEKAGRGVLAFAAPFVLMTLRGRVLLRVGLPIPHVDALAQALALFGVAVGARSPRSPICRSAHRACGRPQR